jgi:modulator of FtsH protease HflK
MTPTTAPDDRRAQNVAALGFLLQLASFGTLLGIALWSGSDAVEAVARFTFTGLPIWVILWLIFKQLRRVRVEQLETSELRQARQSGETAAIFELDDEALLLEQNRLRWMVRWILPTGTVMVAAILLIGQFFFWGWSLDSAFKPETGGGVVLADEPAMLMWFALGVSFLCFLYGRYVIALSRIPGWRLMHAGAVFMFGNAYACLCLFVALMATTIEWSEPLLAFLLRWGMIILGIELLVNYMLEFYRPRTPGVVSRPSFDSRLLSLISEPGGLAKSIAEAVNYQFGFEVSSTWFYQLLQRWLFPIVVVSAVVVLLMTSIVIVDAEEKAVIERFGRVVNRGTNVLGPGVYLKWPYPIEIVYRAPAEQIGEVVLGEATEEEDEHKHKAILWTEAHDYVPEMMLLVAAPGSAEPVEIEPADPTARGTKSVAVSLLMISVPIEFRIRDVEKYLYNYTDPIGVLESVAYQFLTDYGAGLDIDVFMGSGRERINEELRTLIQRRLDELETGIELVFVGVRGAHPPAKSGVAAAFQSAIASQTRMQATINAAEGEARRMLTSVAGTESQARTLDTAIRKRDRLRASADPDPVALLEEQAQVDALLLGDPGRGIAALSGEVSAMIAEARGNASDQISLAAAKVRGFSTEVAAYEAAPLLYMQRKAFEVYADLNDVRKYLLIGHPDDIVIEYIGVEQGGLDRVLSEGVQRLQKQH